MPAVAFAGGVCQHPGVIASVQFKHFKALRATSLRLEPFNLLIGPNGSGKTSLVQALLRLRALARAPASGQSAAAPPPSWRWRGLTVRPLCSMAVRFCPGGFKAGT